MSGRTNLRRYTRPEICLVLPKAELRASDALFCNGVRVYASGTIALDQKKYVRGDRLPFDRVLIRKPIVSSPTQTSLSAAGKHADLSVEMESVRELQLLKTIPVARYHAHTPCDDPTSPHVPSRCSRMKCRRRL
jgi:hypothetical protein